MFEAERRGRESEKRERLGFMRYCGGERERKRETDLSLLIFGFLDDFGLLVIVNF